MPRPLKALDRRRHVAAACLALLLTACAGGRKIPTGTAQLATQCGGVSIRPAGSSFVDAFEIAYDVTVEVPHICIPHEAYAWDVPDARTIELRRADESVETTEALSQPLVFFQAKSPHLAPTPGFERVAVKATNRRGTVPPGRYRLALRYAVAPCHEQAFNRACIATSESFQLTDPTRYVVERKR